MYKYSFVIPCYQHSFTLEKILNEIKKFNLKIFVINDGSDDKNSQELQRVCKNFEQVELIHRVQNGGKGAAVSAGIFKAFSEGYTHAIQIDSDGQHDLEKIDKLLELSNKFPTDLISGNPQYDESVPKARIYGRYATHIWVWIETLSFQLKDSMCGFRVYPLKQSHDILKKYNVGQRMDFDSEIMVRLYWENVNVHFTPVPVIYPKDGISNFDVIKDNILISIMHTRLFFGMLKRLPKLLLRKNAASSEGNSWHKIEELGSYLGIKILMIFYQLTGRKVLNMILHPVCFYYSLLSKNAQRSSSGYRQRLKIYTDGKSRNFTTFEHIYSFANTAVDKFSAWFNDIDVNSLVQSDVEVLLEISRSEQGAFFITSHYGNIEVCRALGRFYPHVQFNALVYYENAKKFNHHLNKVNAESSLNLISVKNVGPEISIFLKEKVDNREWVFMMGDRKSIQDQQRTATLNLLGSPAQVSEGPFILAYLLEVPVYVIHCFREGPKFRIQVKQIEPKTERIRAKRAEYIKEMADLYATELESVILKDPLQWYNFYDFWKARI